jgi:uncharacterized membrane protein
MDTPQNNRDIMQKITNFFLHCIYIIWNCIVNFFECRANKQKKKTTTRRTMNHFLLSSMLFLLFLFSIQLPLFGRGMAEALYKLLVEIVCR